MTPSKEVTDEATNAATEFCDGHATDADYAEEHAALIEVIRRHFADVIRKAEAMDALGWAANECAVTIRGKSCWCDKLGPSLLSHGATLSAAIEALAAKIGGKNG